MLVDVCLRHNPILSKSIIDFNSKFKGLMMEKVKVKGLNFGFSDLVLRKQLPSYITDKVPSVLTERSVHCLSVGIENTVPK